MGVRDISASKSYVVYNNETLSLKFWFVILISVLTVNFKLSIRGPIRWKCAVSIVFGEAAFWLLIWEACNCLWAADSVLYQKRKPRCSE